MDFKINGGNMFSDGGKGISRGQDLPQSKLNFNMAEALKKLGATEEKKPSLSSMPSQVDENGKLKPGESPKVALNKDGTLAPGWRVGADGQPYFDETKLLVDISREIGPRAASHDYVEPDPDYARRIDPGYYAPVKPDVPESPEMSPEDIKAFKEAIKEMNEKNSKSADIPDFKDELSKLSDKELDKRGYKRVPKYELKDGKLVQNGFEIKPKYNIVADTDRIVYHIY